MRRTESTNGIRALGRVGVLVLLFAAWAALGEQRPAARRNARGRSRAVASDVAAPPDAEPLPPPPAKRPFEPKPTSVEIAYRHDSLTSGYQDWNGYTVLGAWQPSPHTALRSEVSYHDRFGEGGAYFRGGVTQSLDEDWYVETDLATSQGGSFFPKFRGDFYANRKVLDSKSLVLRGGLMVNFAKDDHRDLSPLLGAIYYVNERWVVEAGARYNASYPNAVAGYSAYVAATYRLSRHFNFIVGRIGIAREAYQILNTATVIADFGSREASLSWRHRIVGRWATVVGGEYYENPSYRRLGARIGLYTEF